MATTASAFLRNVGEAARQKLRGGGMPVDWGAWPATPFIVRMDACDFMDCEGVVKVEPGSLELNYRKFKRLIAESVVRREYGKWAPKRSDGRPWPLPNRVEVRCRSFVGRAAPARGGEPSRRLRDAGGGGTRGAAIPRAERNVARSGHQKVAE